MPIPNGVEGGGHGGMLISCLSDGAALDLTGATTITGTLYDKSAKTTRTVAGSFAVEGDPTDGQVAWTFAAGDLVAGEYLLQLTINYGSGLPARNYAEPWTVERGY